jgi:hypothetical protein
LSKLMKIKFHWVIITNIQYNVHFLYLFLNCWIFLKLNLKLLNLIFWKNKYSTKKCQILVTHTILILYPNFVIIYALLVMYIPMQRFKIGLVRDIDEWIYLYLAFDFRVLQITIVEYGWKLQVIKWVKVVF